MRKWTKSLKWTAGALMFLVMLMAVPIVQGGGRFSGIDPEVLVNRDKINVYIEWPEHLTCNIHGLIDVNFLYPEDAKVQLTFESHKKFQCDTAPNGFVVAHTKTNLKVWDEDDSFQVSAKVNTSEIIPVNVLVYHNSPGLDENGKPIGTPVQVCEGFSDELVFCDPYQLDDDDNDDDDE